jgi:hypothetical protein
MLFDDEHKDEAQSQRGSVVAKARRSKQAQTKAQRGLTEDGSPVHSFKTLLGDLGTLCRNTIRLKSTDAVFTEFTTPTPTKIRLSNSSAFRTLCSHARDFSIKTLPRHIRMLRDSTGGTSD